VLHAPDKELERKEKRSVGTKRLARLERQQSRARTLMLDMPSISAIVAAAYPL
jgi:hypothetical protein